MTSFLLCGCYQRCSTCRKITRNIGYLTLRTADWPIGSSLASSTSTGAARTSAGVNTPYGTNSSWLSLSTRPDGRFILVITESNRHSLSLALSSMTCHCQHQLRRRATFCPLQQEVREHGERHFASGWIGRSRSLRSGTSLSFCLSRCFYYGKSQSVVMSDSYVT